MKKLILLILASSISSFAVADDLQCKNNYAYFKQQYKNHVNSIEKGDIEEFKKNLQLTQYDRLFSDKHPGQVYFGGDWMTNQKYEASVQSSFLIFKQQGFKNKEFSFSEPKVNFISKIGEVCVFKVSSTDEFLGENVLSQFDNIYVRNLENNKWREFTYLGIENRKDMDEFFPGIVSDLKLEQTLMNGKNFADKTLEITQSLFKSLNIEFTGEVKNEIDKEVQSYRQRLKSNGF